MDRERNVNVDLVRIFALLMVVFVHVFLFCGFYETNSNSVIVHIGVFARQFCMCCVPLFLLLTGYLHGGKTCAFGKEYVGKLKKILIPYVIVTILMYCTQQIRGKNENFVLMLLDFENNGYMWYIEMYIGLYLLLPFLNAGYCQLAEEGKKHLAFVMCLICFIPSVFNLNKTLMMDYWFCLYPFAYYVLGMYLKEHPIKIKSINKIVMLIGSQILNYAIAYYGFKDNLMNELTGYNNAFVAITSILIFSLLLDLDFQKMGKTMRKAVATVADAVLPAYMFSAIVDLIMYEEIILPRTSTVEEVLKLAPIVVISVFVISILAGMLIQMLSRLIIRLEERMVQE